MEEEVEKNGEFGTAPLNRKYRKLDPEKLSRYVKEHPDAYQREMASEFKVSKSCIGKVLRKLEITVKRSGPIKNWTRRNVRSMRGQCPCTKRKM
ncbi:MAG: transposase [Puniceicoccales bacterium]|jgi:hypothetical protein|nr:transposase [Puniceicoccales bacterium]